MIKAADMTIDRVQLIEPEIQRKDEFLAFCRESESITEADMRWRFNEDMSDFGAYIQKRKDNKAGRNLPAGWMPFSEYWLVKGHTVLGISSLRHQLTAHLERIGGHIGYIIRPTERKKGYGTEILRQTLQKARAMNMAKVLVTCADNNIASARIIENNGGQLQDTIWNEEEKQSTRRYRIDLNHSPQKHLRSAVTDLRNCK